MPFRILFRGGSPEFDASLDISNGIGSATPFDPDLIIFVCEGAIERFEDINERIRQSQRRGATEKGETRESSCGGL